MTGHALPPWLVHGTDHTGRARRGPTPPAVVLLVGGLALTPLALRAEDRVPIGVLVGLLGLIIGDAILAGWRIGVPLIRVTAPREASTVGPTELTVEVLEPAGELVEVGFGGFGGAHPVRAPGTVTLPLPRARWGVFEAWTLRVATTGPLGLGACSRRVTHRPAHPTALLPPRAPHAPVVLDEIPGALDDDPVDVVGLREGRAGAPLRDVHWPTVARTGRLVVRERRPVVDRTVPIVVSFVRWEDHPEAALDGSDPIAVARTVGGAVLAAGCGLRLHCARTPPLPAGTTIHADIGQARHDAHSLGAEPAVVEVRDPLEWSLALARLDPRITFDLPEPPYLLIRSNGASWERER